MNRGKAHKLRAKIEQASVSLPDEDALDAVELFQAWQANHQYAAGERVRWPGGLYRCIQGHMSQAGWTPDAAPSLWARVLIPDPEQIPDWIRPDSTNPYAKGNKVRHNGKVWISTIDGNVWEPGIYGWEEVPCNNGE